MNELLQLKGQFKQEPRGGKYGGRKLPDTKNKIIRIEIEKINNLISDLESLKKYWSNETLVDGAFVSVHYRGITAKSNRIAGLLGDSKNKPNSSVVGAKFSEDKENIYHIITHYVSLDIIDKSIRELKATKSIMTEHFKNGVTNDIINSENSKQIFLNPQISKNVFTNIIVDSYYVDSFRVPSNDFSSEKNSIITIYKTKLNTIDLLKKTGIRITDSRIIDETTLLLMPEELELLKSRAPFLISMGITDISSIPKFDAYESTSESISIPKPSNEPIIGVIDTHFDKSVYFGDWVEYTNMVSEDIELSTKDFEHGTAVSSIIVDGPSINPKLYDGCGRFRVKHFGVATANSFSSFTVLKSINEIIAKNKNIKVWNLSLGSTLEINPNFISPEAAFLDKIQTENDVIFVISGTNKPSNNLDKKLIGSPADSINSLVVNSVDFNNNPTSYTRVGPVLSFFQKPDVSYYGGVKNEPIRVCMPLGEQLVVGTSFAAPWIARKVAYLINVLGLTREVAKALIIHSSTTWDKTKSNNMEIGYGVVPIKIEDIINSKDDEIRFTLNGISEEYNTYEYNLPVPMNNGTHPFIAKATMCYFPHCSRNQGVDYTNTELDLYFGVLNGTKIKTVNQNKQIDITNSFITEEHARKNFRKWDNVKHISEFYSSLKGLKVANENGLWGISIKTKERLDEKYGVGIKFGLVITLKELNGKNRIHDFEKALLSRGWLVSRLDVENKIDIYNIAEEEIEFTDN